MQTQQRVFTLKPPAREVSQFFLFTFSFALWRDFSSIKRVYFIYRWGILDWGSFKVVQLNVSFLSLQVSALRSAFHVTFFHSLISTGEVCFCLSVSCLADYLKKKKLFTGFRTSWATSQETRFWCRSRNFLRITWWDKPFWKTMLFSHCTYLKKSHPSSTMAYNGMHFKTFSKITNFEVCSAIVEQFVSLVLL